MDTNENKTPNRVLVELSPRWVAACVDYGKAIVEPGALSDESLRRSGDRGTETNVPLQILGKLAEVGFAIYFRINPSVHIALKPIPVGDPKPMFDLKLLDGTKVDVKGTYPNRKLGWSISLNAAYDHYDFDVLASVTVEQVDYLKAAKDKKPVQCWIEGWVTKQDFKDRHRVSDGKNSKQEIGTWFMEKEDLNDIEVLLHQSRIGFVGYVDGKGPLVHYCCGCGRWATQTLAVPDPWNFPAPPAEKRKYYCGACLPKLSPVPISNERPDPTIITR